MGHVDLIVYDFDGVLTDNRVWVSEDGKESVACNRSDGWWISQIREKHGIEQIILSTEANPVVRARGIKLNIEVIQGRKDKLAALQEVVESKGYRMSRICYIGNEMNDLECLSHVGFSMAPSDAHPKVVALVKNVIPCQGGYGIVRHVFEWLENSCDPS